MSLVKTPGLIPFPPLILGNPRSYFQGTTGGIASSAIGAIDAAGEKIAYMGEVLWEDGASHTMGSSSKIHFATGAVTFASASSTLRVGLQGVSTTTVTSITPDGTWSVYREMLGSSGVITSSDDYILKSITLSTSGSKSVAHGELVAVVFDLIARGVSDSIIVQGMTSDGYCVWPAVRGYTTSWQNFSNSPLPLLMLEADDGAKGILAGGLYCKTFSSGAACSATFTFTSSSSPDEYGLIFQVPFRCKVGGCIVVMGTDAATAADATLRLYATPLGTPSALVSKTLYGEQSVGGTDDRPRHYMFSSEVILEPNTDYCLALEATSTGNIEFGYIEFGDASHRACMGLANCRRGSRTNGTGAFTETTTQYPLMALLITALDDGNGSGAAQMNIGGLH